MKKDFVIDFDNEQNKKQFWAFLKGLKGKQCISVEKQVKTRSANQNRYLWGVVYKYIAAETGYTAEEVHQIMGQMFLTYHKEDKVFVKTTTKLKTVEFDEYIEKVRLFAAEQLGTIIPLPNEAI